jgi:DNA ligase-4
LGAYVFTFTLLIAIVFHMPFLFRLLCDLLERLERNARRSSSIDTIQERDTILVWLNKHPAVIPRRGPEAVAFLSRY